MNKLFRKIFTMALVTCLAITSCVFCLFACSESTPPKDGVDGTNGTDGVSVVELKFNDEGKLVVTLSNGNTEVVEITNAQDTPSTDDSSGN